MSKSIHLRGAGNRKRRAKGVQGPAQQPDQHVLDERRATRSAWARSNARARRAREAKFARVPSLPVEERRLRYIKAQHAEYLLRRAHGIACPKSPAERIRLAIDARNEGRMTE